MSSKSKLLATKPTDARDIIKRLVMQNVNDVEENVAPPGNDVTEIVEVDEKPKDIKNRNAKVVKKPVNPKDNSDNEVEQQPHHKQHFHRKGKTPSYLCVGTIFA